MQPHIDPCSVPPRNAWELIDLTSLPGWRRFESHPKTSSAAREPRPRPRRKARRPDLRRLLLDSRAFIIEMLSL